MSIHSSEKTIMLIRVAKYVLLAVGVAWAAYSSYLLVSFGRLLSALAQRFPVPVAATTGLEALVDDVVALTYVFGPAVLAFALLLFRWPERILSARNWQSKDR